MRLLIDNKEVGSAKTPGLFKKELEVPLRVGMNQEKAMKKLPTILIPLSSCAANLTNAKLETLEGIAPASKSW